MGGCSFFVLVVLAIIFCLIIRCWILHGAYAGECDAHLYRVRQPSRFIVDPPSLVARTSIDALISVHGAAEIPPREVYPGDEGTNRVFPDLKLSYPSSRIVLDNILRTNSLFIIKSITCMSI